MSAPAVAAAPKKVVKKSSTAKKGAKKTTQKFTIDCSEPAADDIFDIASFVRAQREQRGAGGEECRRRGG